MADRTVDLRAAFLGNCPDCGTPLERVRKRRGPGHYIWCWKCVRALRMGEAVAAKRKAYDERDRAEGNRFALSKLEDEPAPVHREEGER